MQTVHAVYEGGVFRPVAPVPLPDHCRVEFEPRVVEQCSAPPTLDDVYALLNARFDSGEHDVAARHNEHQNF